MPSPSWRASAGASASASGGASAACNPPKQDGVTLSFTSFGGVYQEAQRKAWLEPYTQLTGVQFTEDENSSNATIKTTTVHKTVENRDGHVNSGMEGGMTEGYERLDTLLADMLQKR